MRASIIVLAASLLSGPALHAGDPAKAAEILRSAKIEDLVKKSMTMVREQVKSGVVQQMTGIEMPPDQAKMLDSYIDRMMTTVTSMLDWETLKPIYVKLYAEAFSDAEMDGIIAFYKSPAGSAMVDKTPGLMQKANDAMQERMKAIGPEMQKIMQELKEKAAGSKPPKD